MIDLKKENHVNHILADPCAVRNKKLKCIWLGGFAEI